MQGKNLKSKTDRSGSTRKIIRFEDALLAQIESVVGRGNFSAWVKEGCREKLRRLGIEPKS
ncbi:DUF3950 domain-containing protein [Budvicia aquatica]|uniref:DUF3950 domain-containing protein n=1 Tax=Budvicia aquatica TaxID=82979 RepID=A0A2C6DFX5_9GAMM|nr:DUF3950 domain-containing protein [Budvicia aquatica]PHI29188.1 DUF3950 domain-containing protein [Budvicia aquatica]